MGHGTVKCKICGNIIRTCRCMDKNKPINYEVCKKCQGKDDNGRENTRDTERVRRTS